MWLSNELFRSVVDSTPLISIDLVVLNSKGECLLGQRLNRPAQGNWFVPGGRILKNETLDAAFIRLTLEELGKASARSDARLLGVYEHFYADSVFAAPGHGPNTHYVVLAYQLVMAEDDLLHPLRLSMMPIAGGLRQRCRLASRYMPTLVPIWMRCDNS